jgi:hypothetical protein
MAKGIIKKLIKFIKIKVLTKELEFRAPKTQKKKSENDQEWRPRRVSLHLQ